jgi:hypothetical protein
MEAHMQTLNYAVAVWFDRRGGDYYAFPIGAKDSWGQDIIPEIDQEHWSFKFVIPQGTPATEVKPDNGDRVRCNIAGCSMFTGAWVLK